MKELIITTRTDTSSDYTCGHEDYNKRVELCGSVANYIEGVEDGMDRKGGKPIKILLSNNDGLEHEVKVLEQSAGICCYLEIDGSKTQVLSGAYNWVESYLGNRTGSMTISYE